MLVISKLKFITGNKGIKMHWLEQLRDNIHVLLGGAFSFWIYRDQINGMSTWERAFYVFLSIIIGFYGGWAWTEIFNLNPAGGRAHLLTIITTIFGLAFLGLARDNLAAVFDSLKKKWIG